MESVKICRDKLSRLKNRCGSENWQRKTYIRNYEGGKKGKRKVKCWQSRCEPYERAFVPATRFVPT